MKNIDYNKKLINIINHIGIIKYKKKQILKLIICIMINLFVFLTLTSCYPIQLHIENLIKAPKLVGDFYEITRALELTTNENIKLKYPKSGDYRTAFIMHDIDNDGQNEAIVFYTESNDSSENIKFSILDKIGNKWSVICSLYTNGIDIDKVIISKLLSVDRKQIIISLIYPDGIHRTMQVFDFVYGKMECICNKEYFTNFYVYDIDNDGENEIIAIDRTYITTPRAQLIKKIKIEHVNEIERLDIVSETMLTRGTIKYEKIKMGKLNDQINALFLDIASKEENMYTEVIYGQKDDNLNTLIKNPFYLKDSDKLLEYTARSQHIYSRDIDNDSIIEIPRSLNCNKFLKSINNNKNKPKVLTIWQKFLKEGLTFANLSVENDKRGYSFKFPDNWVSISSNLNDDIPYNLTPLVLVFDGDNSDEWVFKSSDLNHEIMSIMVVDSTNPKKISDDYIELEKRNNFIYYVKINKKNNYLPITHVQAKKFFSLITNMGEK